jgi:hypothetical protein
MYQHTAVTLLCKTPTIYITTIIKWPKGKYCLFMSWFLPSEARYYLCSMEHKI